MFYQSISIFYCYNNSYSHCFSLIMPVICHSYKLSSFFQLIKSFSFINFSYRPSAVIKLCPQHTYYSGIILAKLVTYYSYNYAGIIGAGLDRAENFLVIHSTPLLQVSAVYHNILRIKLRLNLRSLYHNFLHGFVLQPALHCSYHLLYRQKVGSNPRTLCYLLCTIISYSCVT